MAHLNTFQKKLDKLFFDRTYNLRSTLGLKKNGRRPKLNRKKIDASIKDLQDLASSILARNLAKIAFLKSSKKKIGRQIKGWGNKKKKGEFEKWFKIKLPKVSQLVYVFWNKKKCIYVGRTGRGGSRPSSHFDKRWCNNISRIDIYPTTSRNTPKLECLAKHYFQPKQNKYKPSEKKWTSKCQLCKVHRDIDSELRIIFAKKKMRKKNNLKRKSAIR